MDEVHMYTHTRVHTHTPTHTHDSSKRSKRSSSLLHSGASETFSLATQTSLLGTLWDLQTEEPVQRSSRQGLEEDPPSSQ